MAKKQTGQQFSQEDFELLDEFVGEDLSVFEEDPAEKYLEYLKLKRKLRLRNLFLTLVFFFIALTIIGGFQTTKYGYDADGEIRLVTSTIRKREMYREEMLEYVEFIDDFEFHMSKWDTYNQIRRDELLQGWMIIVSQYAEMPSAEDGDVPSDFLKHDRTIQNIILGTNLGGFPGIAGVIDLESNPEFYMSPDRNSNGLLPETAMVLQTIREEIDTLKYIYSGGV
jgi:hypothetical protein